MNVWKCSWPTLAMGTTAWWEAAEPFRVQLRLCNVVTYAPQRPLASHWSPCAAPPPEEEQGAAGHAGLAGQVGEAGALPACKQMLHMPQRLAGSPITCYCSGWAMCQFTHSLSGPPSLPPHLTGDVHAVVWADPVPGGLRLHLPEAGRPLCAQRPQAHHPAGWPAATLNACHPAAAPSGAAAQARGSPQAAARQGPPAAAAHAAAPAPPAASGTCPCNPAAGGTAGGRR